MCDHHVRWHHVSQNNVFASLAIISCDQNATGCHLQAVGIALNNPDFYDAPSVLGDTNGAG